MVRPGTYEEIMRRSSTYVDDYTMSLQFPACDWSGYFLFAPLEGDGPCQAVNLGVCIGLAKGDEHNVPQWTGDPDRLFVIASVVADGVSYRWLDDASYSRRDLTYARQNLDLQVADVIRLRGAWPHFEMYVRDPLHDITYELEGRAGFVHWVPDHMQRDNLYSYVCFPDFAFHGAISIAGTVHEVRGTGGLDHVAARTVGSSSSPGVGFWHYDPILWDDGHVSNGLFYLGRKGEPYIRSGVTTIPDGGYHPAERFTIEYLELGEGTANAGSLGPPQVVPRRWRATMEAEHGTLTYETTPRSVRAPDGTPLIEPNVVFDAVGEFHSRAGEVTHLTGKGHNEYMGAAFDPSRMMDARGGRGLVAAARVGGA